MAAGDKGDDEMVALPDENQDEDATFGLIIAEALTEALPMAPMASLEVTTDDVILGSCQAYGCTASMPTDYLTDGRLSKVPFTRLKGFVKENGAGMPSLHRDLSFCTTKLSVVNIAKEHGIELDKLLDEVGPFAPPSANISPVPSSGSRASRTRLPA